MAAKKTVIVTGASQGIGAAVVQTFLDRGYKVVATSRSVSKAGFAPSPNLALVDGDIGYAATAEKVVRTAVSMFGSIDHVVNNAGIFSAKPFPDYVAEDFHALVSTNLEGFIFITQLAVKQMLAEGTGGSVTTVTASLAENPSRAFTRDACRSARSLHGKRRRLDRSAEGSPARRQICFEMSLALKRHRFGW